ncbi:protein phosphatase 2C domain-containing protein [Paenibacillus sepulcri]|uniref:Protein phosphatase 2C domain-containing protein n=1 Tax=Paenibacillus sepulcri TaxID=359917 RepID=A0ABS7C8C8_9BACL|nr:protein phosphatase 2C domain-containing protein [Paenibacillus sepulcri]
MKLTSVTVKGVSPWNEDSLIVNEEAGLFGVVDGATSLVPYTGAGGETGGYLAARLIADYCDAQEGVAVSPLGLLEEANRLLRARMLDAGIRPERKEELWSACAVLIHIGEKWIEFAHAGDCMLAAYYSDGTIRIITHDQLAHVDDWTKAVWAEGVQAGLATRAELWEYAKPQIIKGRDLANAPGGYAVLNGDPAFVDYAEFGRISRTNIESLLLLSDGLYIPKQAGESDREGALEIAVKVREMGLQSYIDWLLALEESDPDCVIYPRVKKSDDKTAIVISFT